MSKIAKRLLGRDFLQTLYINIAVFISIKFLSFSIFKFLNKMLSWAVNVALLIILMIVFCSVFPQFSEQ